MKNKGFTLVEVIAVIAIIGLLVVIATSSVSKYLTSSRESVKESSLKDAQDAALSYALTLFIPDSCAYTGSKSIDESNYSSYTLPTGCTKQTITVQELIDKQYFKDNGNLLKRSGQIIIYKHKVGTQYEVKAFAPKNILNE